MIKSFKKRIKLYKKYRTNLYLKKKLSKKFIKSIKKKYINKINSYFYYQLKEKQKLKIIYGILDKQFYNYYLLSKKKNINIIILLELRLDNVLYRTGLFLTRKQSRQFINHNHLLINNRKVSFPSYQVKLEDIISFKKKFNLNIMNKNCKWIFCNFKIMKFYLKRKPCRKEIFNNINDNLIIDYFNK